MADDAMSPIEGSQDEDLISKIWEPVFPPAERLLHLASPESASKNLRYSMEPYEKDKLSKENRAMDGWSKQ